MGSRKTATHVLVGTLFTLLLGLASAQELVYTFENGALSGPETISVNSYQNIQFVNDSDGELDVTFARLREGATPDEVTALDKAFNAAISGEGGDGGAIMGQLLGLVDYIGGVRPGAHTQASAYLKLEPGHYLVTAATGGGPGDPYNPFYLDVTVEEGESAEAPTADFTLHMSDFHFDFPDTMASGEQLWEVSSTGSQPHMAIIFKLAEGKTAEDVTAWMTDFAGDPPVEFEGGAFIEGITAGQTFYLPVNLTPGTYVAVCPLPNLASGEPHFVEGMVDTFTVQ